jgi:hypothetical protein
LRNAWRIAILRSWAAQYRAADRPERKMTQAEINKLTINECFDKIEYIEMSAKIADKALTATQKKTIKAIEKRLDVLMPDD